MMRFLNSLVQFARYAIDQVSINQLERNRKNINYEFNNSFGFIVILFSGFCFDSFQSSLILVTLFALSQAAPKPFFGGKEQ